MSPSALDKFLAGGTPYTKTRRRLFDWMQRERDNLGAGVTVDGIAAALGKLLRDLPPNQRAAGLGKLLETLDHLYSECPAHVPDWLRTIREMEADGGAFVDHEVSTLPVMETL